MRGKGEQTWRVSWGAVLKVCNLPESYDLASFWLNSSYWPILNLHVIFVRLSLALDIHRCLWNNIFLNLQMFRIARRFSAKCGPIENVIREKLIAQFGLLIHKLIHFYYFIYPMRGKGEQKWRVGWESAKKKSSANKLAKSYDSSKSQILKTAPQTTRHFVGIPSHLIWV